MRLGKIIHDRRGFALYMAAFAIIIAMLMIAAGASAFQHYLNFSGVYERAARLRCLCECGIERGLWLFVSGYGPAAGSPHTEDLTIGSETVHIQVSLDGATATYTVTATCGDKTVTMQYLSQKITGWK